MRSISISELESTYRLLCDVLSDLNAVSHPLLQFANDDEYIKFLDARGLLTDLTFDVSSRLASSIKELHYD